MKFYALALLACVNATQLSQASTSNMLIEGGDACDGMADVEGHWSKVAKTSGDRVN